MSWAEVKKINSDMSKPLNELIKEQGEFQKVTQISKKVNGVNYASNTEAALGDENKNLIISVSGKGRILWIIPIFEGNNNIQGVARLKIDGKRLFCKKYTSCSNSTTNRGYPLFAENFDEVGNSERRCCWTKYTDSVNTTYTYYMNNGGYFVLTDMTSEFITSIFPLYLKDALYFNNGFELEATQNAASSVANNAGFLIGYELYG